MKTEEIEELEVSNAERLAAVRASRIELDAKKKEVVSSLKATAAGHLLRGDPEKALRSCLDAHEIAPDDIWVEGMLVFLREMVGATEENNG